MTDETIPLTGSEGATDAPKPDPVPATETAASEPIPATDTTAEQADSAVESPEPTEAKREQQRRSVQDRIDTLTRRRREAEANAKAATETAERLRKRLEQYEGTKPDPLEYDTDAAYQAAVTAHEFKQLSKSEREGDIADVRATVEQHESAASQARQAIFQERERLFAERVQDYRDVAYSDATPISDEMAAQIQEAEKGPEVAYWLGKNPTEALRIAQMHNPMDVAREIGRIEGRINQPAPNRISQAPPPVEPVATGTGSDGGYDYENPTLDQTTEKLRRAGLIK